jgi:hypothetical protein
VITTASQLSALPEPLDLYVIMGKLQYLRCLLQNLSPNTGLPLTAAKDSIYTAKSFVPQALKVIPGTGKQETVKDAFVRRIRDTMGMQGTDPVFNERGPGLVRVVIALEKLLQLFPDDVDVDNMIDELLETAKKCYLDANDPVSFTRYDPLLLVFSLLTLSWDGFVAAAVSTVVGCFVQRRL